MTEEELDAAVDVIAAVDAGVLQSLNQRIKQRQNPKKPLWTASGLRKKIRRAIKTDRAGV